MNKWKNRIIKKTMEIHKTCSLKQLHPIPSPISNSLTQALSCYSQCKNSVVIMLFINNFRLAVYWHLKHIWVLSLVEKKQLSKHFFTFKYLCLVSNKAYAKYIHAYDFIHWFIQVIFLFQHFRVLWKKIRTIPWMQRQTNWRLTKLLFRSGSPHLTNQAE